MSMKCKGKVLLLMKDGMVNNMKLINIEESRYAQFVGKHANATFLNSIYAAKKYQRKGWDTQYVAVEKEGSILGAALLVSTPLRKYRYFYLPRGFVMNYEDASLLSFFTKEVKAYTKKQNGLYLLIDPYVTYEEHDIDGAVIKNGVHHKEVFNNLLQLGYIHQGFSFGFEGSTQSRWMSVLNVEGKTEEEVFATFDAQTRQNIKNTIKTGVRVRRLERDELSKLEVMVSEASEKHGFDHLTLSFYEEEYDCFQEHASAYYAYIDTDEYIQKIIDDQQEEKNQIHIAEEGLKENPHSKNSKNRLQSATSRLQALEKRLVDAKQLQSECGKEVGLAAAMFVKYGNEIVYLTSGSSNTYKRFKGAYALQWFMIQMSIQEEYQKYNFYGISGRFNENDEGYGVFNFKRGFKADVVELLGDFILPIQDAAYRRYRLLQKIKRKIRG